MMNIFLAASLVFSSLLTWMPDCGAAAPSRAGVLQWKLAQCDGTLVSGRYINYAEGFSITLPRNVTARRGQAAGPERGVGVALTADCTAVVVVSGEPNSLEWAMPADGIYWTIGKKPRIARGSK